MKKIAFLSGIVFSASIFGMSSGMDQNSNMDENPKSSSFVLRPMTVVEYIQYVKQIKQIQKEVTDQDEYTQGLEQEVIQSQNEINDLKKENKILKGRVKKAEEMLVVNENYIKKLEEKFGGNETLYVIVPEHSQNSEISQKEIEELKQNMIELSNENQKLLASKEKLIREKKQLTEELKRIEEEKQLIEKLKQNMIGLFNENQDLLASKETLIREKKQLIEENQELRIFLNDSENSTSEISGRVLADEIQDEDVTDQSNLDSENSTKIQDKDIFEQGEVIKSEKDSSNENDWGLFFKETNNGEDCLRLKGDSFLIKFKLIKDTFSLSNKGDYVKFGFETWYKLVEFKLTADILGEFSLSKSDFSNRQSSYSLLPGRLFWIASPSDYLILTKEFIYKGESENFDCGRVPHGAGEMLKNTGEVLIGKFEKGEYKGGQAQ